MVWEDAPSPARVFLVFGWRCLGLRGRSAPERVRGWTVAESSPERVVLEIPSRIMTARNTAQLDDTHVYWTTDVTFDRPLARLLRSLAVPFRRRGDPRAAAAHGPVRTVTGRTLEARPLAHAEAAGSG